MEDRPRFQTGPREIRPSGIIGGPRETWPGWNCAPTSHTERARMVTLHLYTGAPELYPNNCYFHFPKSHVFTVLPAASQMNWVWLLFGNELPPLHRLKEALLVLVNMEGPVLLEM